MAHWRSMVGKRLGFDVSDLGGKERMLVQLGKGKPGVIEGVINGRKQDPQNVIWMEIVGFPLPLAFKANHCKEMVQIYGTGEVTAWEGKWVWFSREMVPDPQRGKNALTEAVRIVPKLPTEAEIEKAIVARGGSQKPQPARDDAADQALVAKVCTAMEEAKSADDVEAAIAPHRNELKQMPDRLRAVVASTKKSVLATLAQPQEGTPDAQ
jgi:hypothetical protein